MVNINSIFLIPDRLAPYKNKNTYKYKLDYELKLEDSVLDNYIKEWLTLYYKLKSMSSNYIFFIELLELLEKYKSLVIKIGSNKLNNEYIIGEKLNTLNLPTFLRFNNILHCNTDDAVDDAVDNDDSKLINTILVMPYMKLESIYNYNWNTNNFNILKNVIKHIVMSILYARYKIGFIHCNLHRGNILVKQTTKETISYGELGEVNLLGYMPIIMDYDMSFIKYEVDIYELDIYDDLFRIIICLCQDLKIVFDTSGFIILVYNLIKTNNIISNIASRHNCEKLCSEIDKFTIRYTKD